MGRPTGAPGAGTVSAGPVVCPHVENTRVGTGAAGWKGWC